MNARDLLAKIRAGLETKGIPMKDGAPEVVVAEDLESVDNFHIGGLEAMTRLVSSLGDVRGKRLIDLGAGLGGPARAIADATDCHVEGVDLNPEFVAAGNRMSDWVGMRDRVNLNVGDVTDLPFADFCFDAALTVHVHMFVAHRLKFFKEAARVLRPGARLVLFDPVLKDRDGFRYPAPWAAADTENFIASRDDIVADLDRAGFAIESEADGSDDAIRWFEKRFVAAGETKGPPPLGLHLIVGPQMGEMTRNAFAMLNAGAVAILQLSAVKR